MSTQTTLDIVPKLQENPAITPMGMIQLAIQQNADIDKLARLMELHERWEKNEARKAYDVAMTAFKRNPPGIQKNKHVRFDTQKGVTEYDHATLDHVTDSISERLSAYGLSHRWEVSQKEDGISVTCIIRHELGHSESTTLKGPADMSGGKNAIQAIGSAVTYLQRYSLLAATGLAAKNGDDDGNSGAPKYSDLQERLEWIANCRNRNELQNVFQNAYKAAREAGDQNAMKALSEAKDKRKAELP